MGNMHEVPEVFDNDLFRPVFEKMRIANLNIEQMRNYIATEQKGEIMRLRIEGAEEYGIEKGRKEGLEEGIEKGIKKGIEKGRKEEGERKSIEFICNLFSMGIRKKEKLARAVNVPLEFVERVLNDIDSGKISSA
jgi:flagellar biosynthesis/type III secretory pathway protein FliH